jgi:RNA polymerase sigma-70 factor (ECF subfamily)
MPSHEQVIENYVRIEMTRACRALAVACGDYRLAEDALQHSLAKAWERLDRGHEIDSLRDWVFVCALNYTRSHWRRLRRETSVPTFESATVRSGSIEALVDVRRAVSVLPRRQREVVVLHYFLDRPLQDIGPDLGISAGAARNALFNARSALALTLGSYDEGGPADELEVNSDQPESRTRGCR